MVPSTSTAESPPPQKSVRQRHEIRPPFTREAPDLTKPLSRWNAIYWAQAHGIQAALKSDARWAVFEALAFHLPNVEPGAGRLEAITGLSGRKLWDAKKALRRVGLIDYADSKGGRNQTTKYKAVADTRNAALCQKIVAAIHSDQQVKPCNGCTLSAGECVDAPSPATNPVQQPNPQTQQQPAVVESVVCVDAQGQCVGATSPKRNPAIVAPLNPATVAPLALQPLQAKYTMEGHNWKGAIPPLRCAALLRPVPPQGGRASTLTTVSEAGETDHTTGTTNPHEIDPALEREQDLFSIFPALQHEREAMDHEDADDFTLDDLMAEDIAFIVAMSAMRTLAGAAHQQTTSNTTVAATASTRPPDARDECNATETAVALANLTVEAALNAPGKTPAPWAVTP
jgi:hypothetical protein